MGVGCQRQVPVALLPGKTRYPLCGRLGGPQGPSGGLRKIPPPTGILSPDRPVRSESLYRLSCPGPSWLRFEFIHTSCTVIGRNNLVLYNQHSELRKSTSLLGVTFQNSYGSNTPRYKVFTDQYLKGHITKKFLVMETLNHYSLNRYIKAWSVFTDLPKKKFLIFETKGSSCLQKPERVNSSPFYFRGLHSLSQANAPWITHAMIQKENLWRHTRNSVQITLRGKDPLRSAILLSQCNVTARQISRYSRLQTWMPFLHFWSR